MGSGNVGLVYARWGHLPDRSFRLLAFMALVTMDHDDPPTFWGGRETMSVALGRIIPPAPAKSDETKRAEEIRKRRRADFQAVKMTMQPLLRSGVVVLQRESAPGQTAAYSLHLMASTGYVQPVEQGTSSLSTGYVQPVEQGTSALPLTTKNFKDSNLSPTSTQVGTSPAAVENAESKNDELEYAKASEILGRLPDLGGEYLSRVADGPLRQQIIAAARLYLEERNAS